MIDDTALPRLRALDVKRVAHDGAEYFYLRDPLELVEHQLLVPAALAPLLVLLDGTRSLSRVRVELLLRFGVPLDPDHLAQLVRTLSQACLLDDEVYAAALHRARETYRAAPFRTPALAGRVYPPDPDELTALLRGFEEQAGATEGDGDGIVGLISPHIDYARGAPVYAALWRRAAPALRAADVVVIFGTDHSGSPGALTLTRRPYATPWGVLPVDTGAVDAMAAALGEDAAFAEELHHRTEHSVELVAVWLHHVRDRLPCPVIPILCGHPAPLLKSEGRGLKAEEPPPSVLSAQSSVLPAGAALSALRRSLAGRRVVAVAAADLAHVGPAFGDPEPFSRLAKGRVRLADEELLAACDRGPEAVLAAVGRVKDRYRICGLSPIALTLAFTGPATLDLTGYDQCPADDTAGSIVSIAGAILRGQRAIPLPSAGRPSGQ